MENKKIPFLCGGVFFFLLVQTKKTQTTAKERLQGISDGLSDKELMAGFIKAITGQDSDMVSGTLGKNTSVYKNCDGDVSRYFPFSKPQTITAYDDEVKKNYSAALLRMAEFAGCFLDADKSTWLVRVLLDVVAQDSGIADDDAFYICANGHSVTKCDLAHLSHIEVQPFLVGITHYILVSRRKNTDGKDTLEHWGNKPHRSERTLYASFPLGQSSSVKVTWRDFASIEDSLEETENAATNVQDYEDTTGDDKPDASDDDISGQSTPFTTFVKYQTQVIQNGEKNINLVNNGTINLNF